MMGLMGSPVVPAQLIGNCGCKDLQPKVSAVLVSGFFSGEQLQLGCTAFI